MKNLGLIFLVGGGMLLVNLTFLKIANKMIPALAIEYKNASIFRAVTDPRMSLFWFVPFLTAGLMLWLWNLSKNRIKGSSYRRKGMNFGLIYWALTIPGMIMSFFTFQLSTAIIVSWTLSNLGQSLFAGVMYARWRS